MTALLPLLHPLLGAIAVCSLFLLGLRGLHSRRKRPDAARARVTHRRFTPLALLLVAASYLGGIGSVVLLRPELDLAGSVHFLLASGLLATMAFLWLRSPARTGHEPGAARVHVGLGAVAMGTALMVAALGLGLLP